MANVIFFPLFSRLALWTLAKNLVCLKIFVMALTLLYFLQDLPPTNESCIVTIESKSKKLERERGGLDDKLINNIDLNLS